MIVVYILLALLLLLLFGCSLCFGICYDSKPKRENLCDECNGELFQREDDKPEAIKKRLHIYETETKPLLDFYKDKLISINGEQPIAEIAKEIMNKLTN